MDNTNGNTNDPTPNGNNQDVLKIEVFHGINFNFSFLKKFLNIIYLFLRF
jgi:hypothetical protein